MAKLLKLRRGTTTQHGSFTGAEGEVTIDTTKDTAVVHDGSQAGGRPLLREDLSNLPAGTIDNADINGSAAISGTKISPDFGSQDITTTGKVRFANVYSNESDLPSASTYHGMFAHVHSTGLGYYAHGGNWIKLAKLDAPDFTGGIDVNGNITSTSGSLTVDGEGTVEDIFRITDSAGTQRLLMGNQDSAGANSPRIFSVGNAALTIGVGDSWSGDGGTLTSQFSIGKTGPITSHLNHDFSAGIDVTGNISVTGTVDGRDVASDGSKLDGIESGATADQTAAEIRSLVESASDSNVFTDADHSKLNGIESGATADQTGSEIASALNGQNIHTTGSIGRDSTDNFTFVNNTRMDININGSNEFRFESDGDFHADGDVIAFSTTVASDRRLKENIEVIPNALDKVQALNGVSFDWKKTGEKSAGVIAQEVQGVLPEAVKEVTPVGGGDSHLAVNYHALTSILIESIKELKAEIEQLKGGQ